MTMNVPSYHPENPQTMAPHPTEYTLELPTQDGPSTSGELKADPDVRPEQEEACPVCGDRVSGYHYGLLTCESCKARAYHTHTHAHNHSILLNRIGFFKRSVQNNKRYTCAERQSCPMDPAQRKRCPYCRFQKCLAVGMKREAVRADRMRGGRNKFGPLYRRDRQLKQQRGGFHQAGTPHYRIKLEGPQAPLPALSHDFHLLPSTFPAALGPDPFHQSQPIPPGIGQPELPVVLDCTMARERALTAPGLPYSGLYHPGFHGYPHKKRETVFNYTSTSITPPAECATHSLPTAVLTPTPTHTPTSTPTLTSDPQGSSTCFLNELLQGEPDESQVSGRVVASLRREQASRGKHDRLNTFSIMCKMADQTLFGLVEWARNCALFKELKVQQGGFQPSVGVLMTCGPPPLSPPVGVKIEVSTVLSQAGPTLSSLVSRAQDLVSKLRALQLDREEFVCLKYLVLFNPDVKSVQDRQQVERTQERVNRALMEHTLQTHPGQSDKFGQLLLRLPEVRSISLQVEEYLYQRHLLGDLPCNSLLTEMLHAKHT
ncbi:hypothetical protein NFI96_013604 [Prochilodus magdalenae]|nr:hypothetical protein NFI96_013604 [Prochilodus magdalenae]